MTRRAFTLLELLVVIAIMGMMGAMSVGGYRSMQRGMQERSVMQNVNQFIRSAYQRAQIDRQPVTVYFWNETLRSARNQDEIDVVAGKAVAVRRSGRVTKVQGSYLYDEFGDLRFNRYLVSEDETTQSSQGNTGNSGVNLYRLGGSGASAQKSKIYETTVRKETNEPLLMGKNADDRQAKFETWAFELIDGAGGWKAGDAYGFEFEDITLPHGYIFGGNWSRSDSSPVAGEQTLVFMPGQSPSGSVTVSSLRGSDTGSVAAKTVATSDNPAKKLDN